MTQSRKTFIFFLSIVILFFGAITYRMILLPHAPDSEYIYHINKAEEMEETGRILLPHFLFHALTIAHHKVTGLIFPQRLVEYYSNLPLKFDWGVAGLLVTLEFYVAIFLVLRRAFSHSFAEALNGRRQEYLTYILAFSTCIVSPIFLLAPLDGQYYLGYLSPSTIYSIPTQVALKLLSLILFLLTPLLFSKGGGRSWMAIIAILVIANGLAKPNYLIILLPALVTLIVVEARNRAINWQIMLTLFISSFAVLGWQYYFKFVNTEGLIYSSEIVLTGPFEVWASYSQHIAIKFVLSSLFPLFILIAFFKEVLNNLLFKFSLILYVYGLIYSGFLAETGWAKSAANFIWCGQIANFLLFVSSALFFFARSDFKLKHGGYRYVVGTIIFSLHVLAGVIFYFRSFTYFA